jgi:GT2 family glycosyltransferase
MPESSVVLCTYNRSAMVARALAALREQSLPPDAFEIVVVDDGSTDDTPQVLAAAAREMPNLKRLTHPLNRGLAASRNTGVAAARADRLLFTDDDCIPERHWAERLSAALDDRPVVVGAIDSPKAPFLTLCHNVAQFHGFSPGGPRGPVDFIAGANMGLRRRLVAELGGFDSRLHCAEDTEFGLRARLRGYRLFHMPDAVITHIPDRTTLRAIFGYATRHAAATILLRHRYWALLRTPWLFDCPWLLAAASPLIALCATARTYCRRPRLLRHVLTVPVVYALKVAWCWGAARVLRGRRKGGGP